MKNKIFVSWIFVVDVFATKTRRHEEKHFYSGIFKKCKLLAAPLRTQWLKTKSIQIALQPTPDIILKNI